MRQSETGEGAYRRPTIRDVATAAGVSRQTVSNVINMPDRVAPATRSRVAATIDRLGYAPNEAARSLTSKLTRTVAISLGRSEHNPSAIEDPFLHALVREAASRNMRVLALDRGSNSEVEVATYAQVWNRRAVDAFVLTDTRIDDPRPTQLNALGIPFAAFGSPWGQDYWTHDWADVDGAAGMRIAVEHALERGHTRLAFVGWNPDQAGGDVRARGWRTSVAAAGLDASMTTHAATDSVDGGRSAAAELVRCRDRPTAFICASDSLALGTMLALFDHGIAPGVDAAVIGYDDSIIARVARPDITSLRQPLEAVTSFLLDAVERISDDEQHEPQSMMAAPELVIRATSADWSPRPQ